MNKVDYNLELKSKIVSFNNWFKDKSSLSLPAMTNNLYPYTKMFSPISVNNCEIKNRLCMGPMGNVNMADEFGRPSEKMIKYFEARAKGGVGLITTGLVPTSASVDPTVTEKDNLTYFPRIGGSRTNLPGWRNLTYRVHSYGAKIFIQLSAGLGRVGNPECLVKELKLPISSSWNPNFYIPQIPCKRLSDAAAKKIVKNTAQAAADATSCGFDGIYLHGHEGYLLEQMTNTAFNRRKVGRYSNWMQFGLDMVTEIRERVGKDVPILYRIDLSLALNAVYGDDMKKKKLRKFKKERTIDETLLYMEKLVQAGVDMFDVDIGCYDNWWLPHPPSSMPSGCYVDFSELVKKHFSDKNIKTNANQDVLIMAVGKLGYPDIAERVLRDNKADMIMLARPLLSDPEWPNKAYSGDSSKIRPCIGCHACIKEFLEGGHIQCAVCPTTSFESEIKELSKVEKPKKIAIIGAGCAGIVASSVLVSRGHDVHLYEASNTIGGILNYASKMTFKYELKNYLEYLKSVVNNLQRKNNFKLYLGVKATLETLKQEGFDEVIVATGATKTGLVIEGAVQPHVKTQLEVLANPTIIEKSNNIVVIGGGDAGCEIACFIAYEFSKNVTLVEISEQLMNSACTANRGHMLTLLKKATLNGKNLINVYNCAYVTKINSDTVEIMRNVHRSVPDPLDTTVPILPQNIINPFTKKVKTLNKVISVDADLVIMHTNSSSNNELYKQLIDSNAFKKVHIVGDAFSPGKIFDAVRASYNLAINI